MRLVSDGVPDAAAVDLEPHPRPAAGKVDRVRVVALGERADPALGASVAGFTAATAMGTIEYQNYGSGKRRSTQTLQSIIRTASSPAQARTEPAETTAAPRP